MGAQTPMYGDVDFRVMFIDTIKLGFAQNINKKHEVIVR